MTLQKFRWKRLWAVTSILWVVGVYFYFSQEIEDRYYASIRTKEEIDKSAQESKFHDCLARNKTNWFALKAKYGEECKAYASGECKGSIWCGEDFLADLCLKGKSQECRDVFFVSAENLKDVDPVKIRWEETIDRLSFYLRTNFSSPLKIALFLAFLVPFSLRISPFVGRAAWKWFTKP